MELNIAEYKLKIGKKAPHFILNGVDGKRYSLPAGKCAIIFTCNHCPYAKAYEDRIISLANEFGKDVKFIAINSNDPIKYPQDNMENMKIRAKEKNFPFPYLFDETQEIAKNYGANVTPEIFLFDDEHKLFYHGNVDDNMNEPEKANSYFREALLAITTGQYTEHEETSAFGCSIKWKE